MDTTAAPAAETYRDGTWVTSLDGTARAAFTDIGEGYCGDYDPEDPEDRPLWRLDVELAATTSYHSVEPTDDPDWVYPADGSICTHVVIGDHSRPELEAFLSYAANAVAADAASGSVKSAMDSLSYLPTLR